jgi:hypothetical protein
MAQSFTAKVNKLILAIKEKHAVKLLFSTKQFYKPDGNKMTYYTLSEAVWDPDNGKYVNMTVFSAGSIIQIVLFLRDFYYSLEGKEIPTNLAWWEEIKRKKGVEF